MIKICLIDYGMGNLQSVYNALEFVGCDVMVSDAPKAFGDADALILPGVGAFSEAMNNLHKRKLIDSLLHAVHDDRKPLLGICLGMQLLADSSRERGVCSGLSLIPGEVKEISIQEGLRLPHIGWNSLSISEGSVLFDGIDNGSSFYFVHSYFFDCGLSYQSAMTDYGGDITAAVQKGHVFGVQFHPERSQRKGLHLLRNFASFVESVSGDKK